MRPIWFTYHVPKTGGQTLRDHLHTTLGKDGYRHLGKLDVGDRAVSEVDLADAEQATRDSILAIGGHPLHRSHRSLFPGRELREIIFFREPARRLISLYNFNLWRADKAEESFPSFDDWVSTKKNMQAKFSARRLGLHPRVDLDTLVDELDRLWFVGVTEQLDPAFPLILASMGLQPTLPARSNVARGGISGLVSPDTALIERLQAENTVDVALHRICRELHERDMARLERTLGP